MNQIRGLPPVNRTAETSTESALWQHCQGAFLMPKFKEKGAYMEEYIYRLCNCGMSIHEAYSAFFSCVKQGGYPYLEDYLSELEQDDVEEI